MQDKHKTLFGGCASSQASKLWCLWHGHSILSMNAVPAGAASPIDLQQAPPVEPAAHEQTGPVPAAGSTLAVKREATADLNLLPAGSPRDALGDAAASTPSIEAALPAVAVSSPEVGSRGAGLTGAPVNAAHPAATGAYPAAVSMPEARASPRATPGSTLAPSRPTPTRPQFEPIVWQLHQALSAGRPAAAPGDRAKRDPAAADGATGAPAAAAGVSEARVDGLMLDAAGSKADSQAAATAVPAAKAPIAASEASVMVGASGGAQAAAAPPPSKPRFRHSSITWQLHSAAMARRDDGAQPSAAPPAKPVEEEEPGAAEAADHDESSMLPVRPCPRDRVLLCSRQTVIRAASAERSNAAQGRSTPCQIC